ncbi:hypothetical protein [Rhodohalobacter halophilus]|uniref:hypothetical protein n=1 Tax=Rhodohalobacter halophilus TaxID=1812810 RepID=UPI00114CBC5E|nr:hypothetical protein [Rhodohalobacter halophilus]
MKRIYSIILILSIAVGTIQPALPMIESILNHHDFSRLIQVDLSESEGVVCALQCALTNIQKECEMDHEEDEKLLDVDYYPIPLKMSNSPALGLLPSQNGRYIQIGENLLTNYILPNAPPPRHHS